MSRSEHISELEQLVLLALLRQGRDAYGVSIRREIEETGGRSASIAAVYAALDRLQRQRLVTSWLSGPTPERGGRAKKHFKLLPRGATALRESREVMDRMWSGLDSKADPEAS
jgi:PadR family transcriptional regulator